MMVNSTLAVPVRRGKPGASDIDQHVGAMLRARRIALGLTQQQLAERVGITYQQAHKYETGANRISAGRLHALARALEVEPGYFFQGLETGRQAGPQPRQRQMLELTRSFIALPRRHQEALVEMARALAGVGPGKTEDEATRDAA